MPLDAYSALAIPVTATQEEVEARYRFLVTAIDRNHFNANPEHLAQAELVARIVNDAYQAISTPQARASYDTQRATGTQAYAGWDNIIQGLTADNMKLVQDTQALRARITTLEQSLQVQSDQAVRDREHPESAEQRLYSHVEAFRIIAEQLAAENELLRQAKGDPDVTPAEMNHASTVTLGSSTPGLLEYERIAENAIVANLKYQAEIAGLKKHLAESAREQQDQTTSADAAKLAEAQAEVTTLREQLSKASTGDVNVSHLKDIVQWTATAVVIVCLLAAAIWFGARDINQRTSNPSGSDTVEAVTGSGGTASPVPTVAQQGQTEPGASLAVAVLPSATPQPIPTATSSATPTPTQSPTPTITPTLSPTPFAYPTLAYNFDTLKNERWENFRLGLKGVPVTWTGKVAGFPWNSHDVLVDVGQSGWGREIVLEFSDDTVRDRLREGDTITFEAVIRDVFDWFGLKTHLAQVRVIDIK